MEKETKQIPKIIVMKRLDTFSIFSFLSLAFTFQYSGYYETHETHIVTSFTTFDISLPPHVHPYLYLHVYSPPFSSSLISPSHTSKRSQVLVRMRFGKIVEGLKSKIKASLRMRKRSSLSSLSSSSSSSSYEKIEKTDSMRFELRSRKAHKIIQQTLRIADSPTSRTYAL
ncbi:unnamed protein product [Brassica oleracea]